MNWIQLSILFFLLVGFPLFQYDQTIDWTWLIRDNSLVIESDANLPLDEALGRDSKKTVPSFPAPIRFISQLKNSLLVLHGFFSGDLHSGDLPQLTFSNSH